MGTENVLAQIRKGIYSKEIKALQGECESGAELE